MATLNAALRAVIDVIQAPLAGLSPMVGVLLWSIPTALFALLVFKWSSNQDRIAEVKRRIHACLFEIRLFNDDLRAIIRAQGEILRHVLHYQALALKPMIWILPPLVLLMVHLHAYYGFRGLETGETALLTVTIDHEAAGAAGRPDLQLELPTGLSTETPAVWTPALAEMSWRLVADQPGDHTLRLVIDGTDYTKGVRVTDRVVRLAPIRPDRSFMGQLEWPSEPPMPATSPIREISIGYPEGSMAVAGWSWDWSFAWMVVFFVATMVIALALKGKLGVEL
jgi:uncharacterized membrane protein (DUF106 family)